MRDIVIVGNDVCAWMAAAAFTHLLPETFTITLIENGGSEDTPVETLMPSMTKFHEFLELKDVSVARETFGMFSLATCFKNWSGVSSEYWLSHGKTGVDGWAAEFIHFWTRASKTGLKDKFDAFNLECLAAKYGKLALAYGGESLTSSMHVRTRHYAQLMKTLCGSRVQIYTDTVRRVNMDEKGEGIASIDCQSGIRIAGDFFIDCTGSKAELAGNALGVSYQDWTHLLPCDRIMVLRSPISGNSACTSLNKRWTMAGFGKSQSKGKLTMEWLFITAHR